MLPRLPRSPWPRDPSCYPSADSRQTQDFTASGPDQLWVAA